MSLGCDHTLLLQGVQGSEKLLHPITFTKDLGRMQEYVGLFGVTHPVNYPKNKIGNVLQSKNKYNKQLGKL